MKAQWGVPALHACIFSLLQGELVPPHTSDCPIVVVSWGLRSAGCDAPSPVLVVTEFRELVILSEETDLKAHLGVRALHACVFSPPRACWSPPAHLIVLLQSFLVDLGPLGASRQARFWW